MFSGGPSSPPPPMNMSTDLALLDALSAEEVMAVLRPAAAGSAALAAAVVASHAMSVEQVPSGLRLRGGVDIGKVAQSIAGVFKRGAEDGPAGNGTPTLRTKGGGEVLSPRLMSKRLRMQSRLCCAQPDCLSCRAPAGKAPAEPFPLFPRNQQIALAVVPQPCDGCAREAPGTVS